jgi:hypothetical protein
MTDAGLIDRIAADLESVGLVVRKGESPSVVMTDASTLAGSWTTYVWVREAESQVIVHGVLPWAVPEEARTNAAIYLTLANFGLLIGNFEMDLLDGELRYKTSADFENCELPLRLVRNLVAANLRTMERYLPGLAVVAEGADPRAAVAAVESSEHS